MPGLLWIRPDGSRPFGSRRTDDRNFDRPHAELDPPVQAHRASKPSSPALDGLSSGIVLCMATEKEILRINDREVTVTNPGKVYFPQTGHTKLDLVRYYLAVADGALRGAGGRPMALKRFVDGAAGEPFFQKRAPDNRPSWIRTAELTFPSGRTADQVV